MRTRTIKSIAALALTGAGSVLVLGFKTTDSAGIDAFRPGGATGSTTTTGSTTGSSSAAASGSGNGSGSGSGNGSGSGSGSATYADGTYKGVEVSEPWGPFEVQVVVSNGKITNVTVLESPPDRRSSRINSEAVPLLTEATIAAQSANIDIVSGATWTSESYAYSLQSALDAARAAG